MRISLTPFADKCKKALLCPGGSAYNSLMRKQLGSASYRTFDTVFERLPIECDEGGGYVVLRPACTTESKPICPACSEHAAQPPEPAPSRTPRCEPIGNAASSGEMVDPVNARRAIRRTPQLPAPRPAQGEARRAVAHAA
jgi:hypothetical protein